MTDDRFRLTALDARRWDFGNALRGYDRARVEEFREQVAEELERLARQAQELETKASNFLEQLKAFRERDKALNEALVSAQQLRGEIRGQAEREAQLIIREARGEAERIIAGVQGDVKRAEEELGQLWRARKAFLAQMRALVERHATELEAAESVVPPAVAVGGAPRDGGAGTMSAASTVPATASLNPTQAFPIPAIPDVMAPRPSDASRDASRDADESGSFRISLDTSTPREPALGEPLAEPRARPSMPTPSWLDAVDEDEAS
jgi:cell division septum initiation protein DivIVA